MDPSLSASPSVLRKTQGQGIGTGNAPTNSSPFSFEAGERPASNAPIPSDCKNKLSGKEINKEILQVDVPKELSTSHVGLLGIFLLFLQGLNCYSPRKSIQNTQKEIKSAELATGDPASGVALTETNHAERAVAEQEVKRIPQKNHAGPSLELSVEAIKISESAQENISTFKLEKNRTLWRDATIGIADVSNNPILNINNKAVLAVSVSVNGCVVRTPVNSSIQTVVLLEPGKNCGRFGLVNTGKLLGYMLNEMGGKLGDKDYQHEQILSAIASMLHVFDEVYIPDDSDGLASAFFTAGTFYTGSDKKLHCLTVACNYPQPHSEGQSPAAFPTPIPRGKQPNGTGPKKREETDWAKALTVTDTVVEPDATLRLSSPNWAERQRDRS